MRRTSAKPESSPHVVGSGLANQVWVEQPYGSATVLIIRRFAGQQVIGAAGEQVVLLISPEQEVGGFGQITEPNRVAPVKLNENGHKSHTAQYAETGALVALNVPNK